MKKRLNLFRWQSLVAFFGILTITVSAVSAIVPQQVSAQQDTTGYLALVVPDVNDKITLKPQNANGVRTVTIGPPISNATKTNDGSGWYFEVPGLSMNTTYQICSQKLGKCVNGTAAAQTNAQSDPIVVATAPETGGTNLDAPPNGKVCPTGTSWNKPSQKCFVRATDGNCPAGFTKVEGNQYNGGTYCLGDPVDQAEADSANDGATLDCEILNANPLNWFICPIVTGLQSAVNGLNNAIDTMLTVNTDRVFSKELHKVWSNFRTFAMVILVIAGLLMIIAQAANIEILDAYTMRKLLPRILITAIFITLSWDILKYAVALSNELGNSIRAIIYQPFNDPSVAHNITLTNSTKFVGILVGGVALISLGLPALLTYVLTFALAILVGFVVLLVREIIIMGLVAASAGWIAAKALPGTEKFGNFCQGTFISMLVLFPIASGLIAIGHVFALIIYNASATPSMLEQIEAGAAWMLGDASLAVAPRLAGGAMATLFNIANDKGRGGFDRLKNLRKNTMSNRFQRMKNGDLYKGRNVISRGFNSATMRAGMGVKGRFGLGEQGRAAMEQRRSLIAGQHAKTDAAAVAQHNDPLLQAMTYKSASEAKAKMGKDFGASEAEIKEAIAGVQANGGFSQGRALWAAKQLAATGTGYSNMEQMTQTIARVSGGNKGMASAMVGEMRSSSERAGRNDLKAGFGTMQALAHQAIDNGGSTAGMESQFTNATIEAARGIDNAQMMRSNKPVSVGNMTKALTEGLETYTRRANDMNLSAEQRDHAAAMVGEIQAKLENMQSNTLYGPEANTAAMYGGTKLDVANHTTTTTVGPMQAAAPTMEQVQTQVQRQVTVVGDDGRARRVDNPNYRDDMGELYNQQRQQRSYNPNDPNNIPGREDGPE